MNTTEGTSATAVGGSALSEGLGPCIRSEEMLMSDVLISRLANCRAMAAERLPAPDVEAIDLAMAEIAELKEAYALLFKAHAAALARLEDPTSMDCASCEYVAPTRHEQCEGCERTVTVHTNYKRASWA